MNRSVLIVGEAILHRILGLGLTVTFCSSSVEVGMADGLTLVHVQCHDGGWVATQLGPDPSVHGQAVDTGGQSAFRSSADPTVIADFVGFVCERRLAVREAA